MLLLLPELDVNQKEYYKNGKDPEWLLANQKTLGAKITKQTSKMIAAQNESYFITINLIDEKMKDQIKITVVATGFDG